MKRRLTFAVSLAAVWLAALLVFIQRVSPVISSPAARASASPLDVVINEVAWAGTAASSSDEWVELKNNTSSPITLTGWTLTNTGSISVTLVGVVPANGYFLLERTDDDTVRNVPADQFFSNSLLNPPTPDQLGLRDNTGAVIDTANGDGGVWPAGTAGPNYYSMERVDPLTPDTDSNWASNDGITRNGLDANNNPINGTPKQPNSATSADLSIAQAAPSSVLIDQAVTYTLVFSNAGRLNVANAIITDTLPLSTTFVNQTSPYTFTQVGQELVWQVRTLLTSSGNLSVTFVVIPDDGFTGWLTNTAVIRSEVPDYRPANNVVTATTQVVLPSADVSVSKSAPASLSAGGEITYVITISNVGQLDAQGVRVTDTLPISVTFVRQSAPYALTHEGRVLTWDVGDVLTFAAPVSWTATGWVGMSFSGAMTNTVVASTVTYEPVTANNSAQATTFVMPPSPVVLINGVLYDGYQLNDTDEAIQIINVGLLPVNLLNWRVTKGTSSGAVFPTYTLPINQRVWATRNAVAFRDSFGFWPDFAMQGTLSNSTALTLTGSWAELGNTSGGDVQLKDAAGNVVDRLVYLTDSSGGGWSGPGVYPYGVGGAEGQILARVPDERTGLPIPDTDTAADWIQYTGSYTTGQRVLYPGWDMTYPESNMAGFFWPFTSTVPATITLGVAPDNAYDVVRDAIRSAQRSIEIETYELQHYGVITEVVQKARAGMSVTVLLEGGPVGGMQDQERWACQEIEAAGGQCWFMRDDASARIHNRYRHIHTKFILIDRERLLVSTQNLTGGGMPDDAKSDGTWGSRGYVLLIESPQLAAQAGTILDRDRDPAHADIARWGMPGFTGPVAGFVPITTSGGTTTTVLFPVSRVFTDATSFELFTAPEAALRQSDGLLGLLSRAGTGDEVYVEQMYEYPDWGDAIAVPNLRLKAYLDAARRGARVRILLNQGQFDEDYVDLTKNITTTVYLNSVARQENLDLQARMSDPTRYGIHSKLVLVKLDGVGSAYSHVSSINGSEESSKINRELALQVESQNLYAGLFHVFWSDWNLSAPVLMPLIIKSPPPVDHLLISEVLYNPGGLVDTGKEWVELFNYTSSAIDLTGWSIGDALTDGEYRAGRYRFPDGTTMQPGRVIVIAQQAVSVTFRPDFEFLIDPSLDDPIVPNMIPVGRWDGFGFELGNTGDKVILRDTTGKMVDAVTWGTGSVPVPGVAPHPGVSASDHSLERYPPYRDTDDCSADFRDQPSPTPGRVPQ